MRSVKKAGCMLIAVLLAGVFALGFAGCGKQLESIDTTKTQLYVKYYNGGMGREWIDEIISDFEAAYANESFEDGKTGVQVVKDFEKSNPESATIASGTNQVYIIEDASYYDLIDSYDALLDITDVVTGYARTGADSFESGRTIEQKLSDSSRTYFNLGTEEKPQYYGIPYYSNSMNIVYNIDLFDKQMYYFKADIDHAELDTWTSEQKNDFALIADLFVTSLDEARSLGPDGVKSDDDGLPATYAEMEILMAYMRTDEVIPFIWNGNAHHYLVSWANDIWANFEGAENMQMNFSFSGNPENLVDVSSSGEVTQSSENGKPISGSNAYLLHKQEGKYQALRFLEMVLKNYGTEDDPAYNYYGRSFNPSFQHTTAQEVFVKSGYEQGYNDRIGMLVDGTWWSNEARGYFSSDEAFKTRKFGIMPVPKADATHIEEPDTHIADRQSLIFISSGCDEDTVPLAKAFVSWLQSDASLNTFTRYTNTMRNMEYTLTDDTLAEMNYFGRQVNAMYQDENTDIIDWLPLSEDTRRNSGLMAYTRWGFSRSDGTTNPADVFYNNFLDKGVTNKLTAAEYFNQIAKYYKDSWSTLYRA